VVLLDQACSDEFFEGTAQAILQLSTEVRSRQPHRLRQASGRAPGRAAERAQDRLFGGGVVHRLWDATAVV